MEPGKRNKTAAAALIGGIAVILILVIGTIFTGRSASHDTKQAVHSVSLLYLDELAGRREQVVASNLKNNIEKIRKAVGLMTEEDLSDEQHLQQFQLRMRTLYELDKFAFVDIDGNIYTADGVQTNIDDYHFDHLNLTEPEVSVLNEGSGEKKVVIAVPVDLDFQGKKLKVCFMEIDMKVMLEGASIQSSDNGTTFCNIYTTGGTALTNTVLGGLAVEDNLLDAMEHAEMESGYSMEQMRTDFAEHRPGIVSFTYNGIQESLSYVPIKGTDWMLTYLIREKVISEKISAVSERTVRRTLIISVSTALVLMGLFGFVVAQMRKNAKLELEKETSEAENRARRQEMEERIALQDKLLEQERARNQEQNLIKALAADYWSVYYLELDKDEGICYQSHEDLDGTGFKPGEQFRYLESVTAYANTYVTDEFREEFLRFIQPENIRNGLKNERVISYRYMVKRHGKETYEMVRFAGVRHPEDREDHLVHAVGACFTNVDAETRRSLEQNQALSDALKTAEQANKAKTAFLSNMSHEIRTPMNAIIGLDSIALNEEGLSDTTRDYLEKIGASANHLLTLINDILDMSRIESGRMTLKNEEFAFFKLIEQINTIFSGQCSEKGLHYHCRLLGEPDDYYIGDNMKLRQVLINILGNAVKFTPEGGTVDFTAERTAKFDGRSTLRFVIRDTGIGMSQEYLPHIFDTFSQEDSSSTNKYGSSGLGMAITKSIVEMMNGTIDVKSEKGKGSVFTVTVTLMDSDRQSAVADQDEIRPGELNVLVIDDDPVACEHAKLVLGKVGIYCETATSGEEAVEMVTLRHARRDPYRLILVDWKMPVMDGIETTRRIRDVVGNESAIIILTAYRWDDVYDEAREAGVDSFLPKPLFATSVIEEFRDALAKKNLLGNKKPNKADLKGKRILLAEDIDVNAEIIAMILQMREMDVDLAQNGRIALELFSSHPEGYYDAILMDMRMPEMDGLEATRRIRDLDRADAKTVPIIALTANAFDEDVQNSLQAGLNAHLSKPVEPQEIYDTLESLIPEESKSRG